MKVGPSLVQRRVLQGGRIEINYIMYSHPQLTKLVGQARYIHAVVFPDDLSRVWVVNVDGSAFPASPQSNHIDQSRTPTKWGLDLAVERLAVQRDVDAPKVSGRMSKSAHPHWVHDLMDEVIKKYWLTSERLPASLVFCAFLRELHFLAAQYGRDVPKVNVSFLHRKIRRLDPFIVTRSRYGLAAANRQARSKRRVVNRTNTGA